MDLVPYMWGVLGFLASFLGIGGGPVNVSLLMLMFALPIKEATLYSLSTIFFSQLAKLVTIALTSSFMRFDLSMLFYVIPAAVIGGLWGARFSRVLSPKKVTFIFSSNCPRGSFGQLLQCLCHLTNIRRI